MSNHCTGAYQKSSPQASQLLRARLDKTVTSHFSCFDVYKICFVPGKNRLLKIPVTKIFLGILIAKTLTPVICKMPGAPCASLTIQTCGSRQSGLDSSGILGHAKYQLL